MVAWQIKVSNVSVARHLSLHLFPLSLDARKGGNVLKNFINKFVKVVHEAYLYSRSLVSLFMT